MADADHYDEHLRLHESRENASKFYSQFLIKILFVGVFLAVLALLPYQVPEFINQTLNTRGWEFLHLVFVGLAVSYGIFSRRNEGNEKENKGERLQKFENSQSYVSRLLHTSSVFGEEGEVSNSEREKVAAWSSQYYRNDPLIVTEDTPFGINEKNDDQSVTGEKPLLLPIRRLRSHSSGSDADDGESLRSSGKREEDKQKVKDVYPAPSPWKVLMDAQEKTGGSSHSYSLPTLVLAADEAKYGRSMRVAPAIHPPQAPGGSRDAAAMTKPTTRIPLPPPLPPRQFIQKATSLQPIYSSSAGEEDLSRCLNKNRPYGFIGATGGTNFISEDEEDDEDMAVMNTNAGKTVQVLESTSQGPLEDEDGDIHSDYDEGPDVDKQADEFIARFREQIRLQRIEDIKKATKRIS